MSKPTSEFILTISNGSSQSHPAILLRKFFAMVFIQPGGKEMDIFIATIFGGIEDENLQRDGFPLPNYNKRADSTCYLNFSFQSKLLVRDKCTVHDATKLFCSQREQIECVWCDEGGPKIQEYSDEKTAANELKVMYPEFYAQGGPKLTLAPNTHPKVYKIEKGGAVTHRCMAVWGNYGPGQANEPEYTLSVPMKVDGLEAVNWIRTKLVLSENVLDRRVRFAVELASGQTFYTPDFTWYFAPPPGSAVNEDIATLIIGDGEKEIPNNIQNVRDDTTVLFQEWEELDIEDRRKARIQLKLLDQWQNPFKVLSDVGRITASFETFDPERESNHQFMVGLVVAFILSFCSDKTRINDFYLCLKQMCQCVTMGGICHCENFCNLISILAPLVVLLNFWVYAYNPQKCLRPRWKERHRNMWRFLWLSRYVALITFATLAVYIFGVWPVFAGLVGQFISCTWNWIIICFGFGINILCSVLHIGLMKFRCKRSPKY